MLPLHFLSRVTYALQNELDLETLGPITAPISFKQKMDLSSLSVSPDGEDHTLTTIRFTTVNHLFSEVDRVIGDSMAVKRMSSSSSMNLI